MADDSNGKSNGGLLGGLLGGLFSGLFGVVGQGMANSANRKINQSNNLFNAQQAQLQRDWQEEMYNRYSSPSALVQQYQEAGLNPALVGKQGQGAMFSGSSASASSPIAMQNPLSGLTQVARDMVELDELIKNGVSHRAKEASEAKEADARAKSYEIENEFKPDLLKQDLDRGELNLQNLEKGLTLLDEQIKNVESNTHLNYGSLRNYIASSNLSDANRDKVYKEIERLGEETTLLRIQQGVEEMKKIAVFEQANRDNAQASLIDEQRIKELWLNSYREKHNMSPEFAVSIWNLILQSLSSTLEGPEARSFNLKF